MASARQHCLLGCRVYSARASRRSVKRVTFALPGWAGQLADGACMHSLEWLSFLPLCPVPGGQNGRIEASETHHNQILHAHFSPWWALRSLWGSPPSCLPHRYLHEVAWPIGLLRSSHTKPRAAAVGSPPLLLCTLWDAVASPLWC